jgi:hypothetical protein
VTAAECRGVAAAARWRGSGDGAVRRESERGRETGVTTDAMYALFVECPRSGTRQRFFLNFKILFIECPRSALDKENFAKCPRATLGKDYFIILC